MTKTTQLCSYNLSCEISKNLIIKKQIEPEDNISLYISACENLNKLYEALTKLNNKMEIKIMEIQLNLTKKGVIGSALRDRSINNAAHAANKEVKK